MTWTVPAPSPVDGPLTGVAGLHAERRLSGEALRESIDGVTGR